MKLKTFRESLFHDHTTESIQRRISEDKFDSLVRDIVYGGSDGIVTTFAIVAGVSGAELSPVTVLILGFSNVLADGFSMAAGNYLGTKTELNQKKLITEFEKKEIERNPEGEIEEVRQIFRNKGFHGKVLEDVVKVIIENRQLWVNTMLSEEYGLPARNRRPMKAAIYTFFAFIAFGVIPMIPYVFNLAHSFRLSAIMAGMAFFILGALRSLWSVDRAWKSGLETLFIGGLAASLAYVVGVFLKGIV